MKVNLTDDDLFLAVWGSGASSYPWYSRWDVDEDARKLGVLIDLDGERESATLTVGTLRRSIEGVIEKYPDSAVSHVDWADEECDSDVDADIADQIVQYAVLGDVVFG
jgi:hypothetical protein